MTVFADQLGEREYVPQYSIALVGIVIHINGTPSQPDGDVTVDMQTLDESGDVFLGLVADNPAMGVFEVSLQSQHTATMGLFRLEWNYEIGGEAEQFISIVEVAPQSPDYDNLSDEMKVVVEQVINRFADLFDSDFGGPHLQVYFQTRFTRGRLAQLLGVALRKLNIVAQPQTTYNLDDFPLDQWGGLLEQGLYIEVIKHLRRSYVEQPLPQQVNVARLDRRDYLQRWGDILSDEDDEYQSSLEHFKIRHMGLGSPRVMVSGGVYGTYGPTRMSLSAAARPRYWFAFHT